MVVDQFFSHFGWPLQIHSDQGTNFESGLFTELCQMLKITKTRTTPYHPCSNGQVERYNRTLLQMIRCYLEGKQNTWDQNLHLLTGAIRSMQNRNTGFSPNMMMLGWEVVQPIHITLGKVNTSPSEDVDSNNYVDQLRNSLDSVHELARDSLKTSQECQK